MPIRNPFARRTPGATPGDNDGTSANGSLDVAHPGFERVDTVGSKASSGLSIRSRRSQDTGEYKMSVVNDSGVYLPPSPTEREATWPRRYLSRASSETNKSSQGEIEHFSISRESFDSYRRSFDITAKSPVSDLAPRQSLDSAARFPRQPRSTLLQLQHEQRRLRTELLEREPPTPEEGFEDVGLNDDSGSSKQQSQNQVPPKRRGFFSKFGTDYTTTSAPVTSSNSQTPQQDSAPPATATSGGVTVGGVSRFLPGHYHRKRGHSGQGAELGAMPVASSISIDKERPGTANSASLQEQEVQS